METITNVPGWDTKENGIIALDVTENGCLGLYNGLPPGSVPPSWIAEGQEVVRIAAHDKYGPESPWTPSIKVGDSAAIGSVDRSDNTVHLTDKGWLPWVDLAPVGTPVPTGETGSEVEQLRQRIAELEDDKRHWASATALAFHAMSEAANRIADQQNYCSEYEDALDTINSVGDRAIRDYYHRLGKPVTGHLPDFEGRNRTWVFRGTVPVTIQEFVVHVPVSGTGTGANSDAASADPDFEVDQGDIDDAIREYLRHHDVSYDVDYSDVDITDVEQE